MCSFLIYNLYLSFASKLLTFMNINLMTVEQLIALILHYGLIMLIKNLYH